MFIYSYAKTPYVVQEKSGFGEPLFSFVTVMLQMQKGYCILIQKGVIYNHKETKGDFEE